MISVKNNQRRRWFFLATALIVASMLLSACGGTTGNNTGTDTVGTEAVGTEQPGTEVTQATETEMPDVEPTDIATEAATAEATAVSTAESTEVIPSTGVGEPVSMGMELFAEGFSSPLVMIPAGDDSGRLFAADMIGVIYILDENGERSEEPFLDLRDRMVEIDPGYDERGLLGLAFHPDFANNNRFYVYYSAPLADGAPEGWDHTSHISEFTVSADNPDMADPNSERILLTVDQPQLNHNGGQIAFGPDGFLYIPLGDGGAADDNAEGHVDDWYEVNAGGNDQDMEQNLLGSILRIDVDSGDPYGVPEDNANEEQWAWGFRNPYRISFDLEGDGALYVGDAGQNLYEEVDVVTAGGNYGWNVKEGTHCFSTDNPDESLDECPNSTPEGEPLIDPVIEFMNTATFEDGLGNTVIGGNVYRGSAMSDMVGQYIFGVWSTSFTEADGALFVADPAQGMEGLWEIRPVDLGGEGGERLNEFLLSFGTDANNELYILTTSNPGPSGDTGKIYRLVSGDGAADSGG